MLKIAYFYKDRLQDWLKDNIESDIFYYYFIHCNKYDEFDISPNDKNKIQYVSVNKNDDIIGYMSAVLDRNTNSVQEVPVVRIGNQTTQFGIDLLRFFDKLYEFGVQKCKFTSVVGSEMQLMLETMVEKIGGRKIGVLKRDCRLRDGSLADVKLFEVTREEYEDKRKREVFE